MFVEEITGGRSFGIVAVVTHSLVTQLRSLFWIGWVYALSGSVTFLWQMQITSEKNSFACLCGRKAAAMGTATL